MSELAGPKFACTSCGKEYRWKPELAGKKGKCRCGGMLLIPAAAPVDEQPEPGLDPFGDMYDVADQPPTKAPAYAPTMAAAATATATMPTVRSKTIATASEGGGEGPPRELRVIPALKWIGIGMLVGFFALLEMSSPTDPDAPARKWRAILKLANNVHPRGALLVLAAFAVFMLVTGMLVLFGKVKDDDSEHAKEKDLWPASRGRRA